MSCVKQHNYVISLTRETKRRKHIEQEFGRQNILFSFFDAVTPDRIEDVAKKFNIILDRSSEAKLWDGEIGCALSHISLWNLALEKNLDYINIFEDDIDVLKLEANGRMVFRAPRPAKYDRKIYPITFKQSGTAGYTVTAKGAKYLLEQVKNKPLEVAIDSLIFEHFLNLKDYKVVQLSPGICVQDFVVNPDKPFESSLQKGRESVCENQTKFSVFERIINEFMRVKRKLFMKQVPFK